ncbi:MAG: NAD-dependent epimerase/dehydratase family protein, partial [Chloroflexi bacterium]|nr:NAD-dependent epimerase/dehydratase family protein [Chloroflexota bacterium]
MIKPRSPMNLKGQKVFVTGATGFIGGRLVEKLLLEQGAEVIAFVRNWSQCARLARFPVKIIKGSLSDRDAINSAMAGCSVVFHLAFDPSGVDVNLDALSNLAAAAKSNDVRRFVHVGTISVYEPLPDGVVDETSPAKPIGQFYADAKLAVEQEVLRLHEKENLPAVIIQPTIVYGPFSKPWTDGPAMQLLNGDVVLPDGGNGVCNAVYVDDVAQALVRAADSADVEGNRYLISGPEPTTWGQFYGGMASALDIGPLKFMPRDEIERVNSNLLSSAKLLLADPKRVLLIPGMRPLAMWVKNALSDEANGKLKVLFGKYRKVAPRPVFMPDASKLALFACKSEVSIAKAQTELGYTPEFDLDKGMAMTSAYLRWAYGSTDS